MKEKIPELKKIIVLNIFDLKKSNRKKKKSQNKKHIFIFSEIFIFVHKTVIEKG